MNIFMGNNKQSGFTLIEAIIAMFILAVGIFGMYSMQIVAVDSNARANNMTVASNWGADQIEQILSMDYDDLLDTDSDGTAQDPEADGDVIDDDGGNFGLDDRTDATADGKFESPDGFFTVFWNVAVDHPTENLKTVRFIVDYGIKAQTQKRYVTYDYVKAAM